MMRRQITGFTRDPWYQLEKDGPIEEYLAGFDDTGPFPLFKGYEPFKELWNKGYINPNSCVIRLVWSKGRGDEHFYVRNKMEMNGVACGFHSGRDGKHPIREVLTRGPLWEAQNLSPSPTPRLDDRL